MARNQHSPEEKARLVLEAFKGEITINEIAAKHGIHPNMLSKWKRDAEKISHNCLRQYRLIINTFLWFTYNCYF